MRKVFGPNLVPSRRMVLRGAGATLLLPVLPSLLPRSAWGASSSNPIRLVVAVVPNGIYTPAWEPVTTGYGYELLPILSPIAALQSRFTVISNTENLSEAATYDNHDPAMGSLLTDTPIPGGGGGGLENGISFDQIAADIYGAQTPFRSMQLGVQNNGGAVSGYSEYISWGNGDTPFPPILDPKTAFGRMFGTSDGLSEEQIAGRKTMRSSVLDGVLDRTVTLQSRASVADARKLDQYQTAVRELELQIERLDDVTCVAPPEPGTNPQFGEATQLMYDLMHVAFTCDLTRTITFLQGPSASNTTYSHLGISKSDHSLSHGAWYDDSDRADRITMQTWQFQMFTDFMQKLADTTDADGSDVLSNTICVFTSEFGDANSHLAYSDVGQPIGIGGGENAGIVQGQHRSLSSQSHANVWLGLLQLLGIDQPTFGTYGTSPVDLTT